MTDTKIIENAARKYFPLLTEKEQINLLWCATCYPAGNEEMVETQFKEIADQSNGNYDEAMRICHEEMDKAMANRIK